MLYFKQLHPQVQVYLWYLDYLLETAIQNPAFFGLKVSTTPCVQVVNGTNQICSNPDSYVFWDPFHTTTKFHSIMGRYAAGVMDSALSVVDVPNDYYTAAASHTQSLYSLLVCALLLSFVRELL